MITMRPGYETLDYQGTRRPYEAMGRPDTGRPRQFRRPRVIEEDLPDGSHRQAVVSDADDTALRRRQLELERLRG